MGLPDFAVTVISAITAPLGAIISATVANWGTMPVTNYLDVAVYIDGNPVATRTINLQPHDFIMYLWWVQENTSLFTGTHVISVVAEGNNAFGYAALPSGIAGGPSYNWINITDTGTAIPITAWKDASGYSSYYEGFVGPITLGFAFPFYGDIYTDVYPNVNGYLTFITGNTSVPDAYSNPPSLYQPKNAVFPFGQEMYIRSGVTQVYYQTLSDPTRFVLLYQRLCTEYYPYPCGTFEVILYPNGDILMQYQNLEPGPQPYLVGTQNAAGTSGLWLGKRLWNGLAISTTHPPYPDVAFSPEGVEAAVAPGDYEVRTLLVQNLGPGRLEFVIGGPGAAAGAGMAVEFRPRWYKVSPQSGQVPAGGSMPLVITMSAAGLLSGTYSTNLIFNTNDPDEDPVKVPLTMTIGPPPGTVVGLLDLQGRSNESGALVTLSGSTHTTTTAADGSFTSAEVAAGIYTATASMPGYLSALRTSVVVSEGLAATLPLVKLLGGNADRDGDIDIYDLTPLRANFGLRVPPSTSSTSSWWVPTTGCWRPGRGRSR